jgi:hypothetical protein
MNWETLILEIFETWRKVLNMHLSPFSVFTFGVSKQIFLICENSFRFHCALYRRMHVGTITDTVLVNPMRFKVKNKFKALQKGEY